MHIKSLFNRDGIFGFIGLFLFFCGLFLVLTPPHHNSYFIFHKDQPYTTADFILYSSMRELSGHDAAKQNYIQEQYENFNSTDALSLEDIVLLKTGFLFFPWLILLISIPLILYALYFRRLENMLLPIVNSIRKSGEVILADLAFTYGLTEQFILKHFQIMNSLAHTKFIYDPSTGYIIDSRLKQSIPTQETCPSCGNILEFQITLDLARLPVCDSCGNAFSG